MIVVFSYHTLHFRVHTVQKMQRKIIGILMVRPHVAQLVHDHHTDPVAGIQHGLTHGMMGTADTVKTCLL